MDSSEIYIVEDDLEVCDSLCAALARAGYFTTCFTDGSSFLRAAYLGSPACVVLNISMSDPLGLDILEELDASNYSAPILIVSSRSDIPTVVSAIRHGAFDFIEKGLDADRIVERVREAMESWAGGRGNGSTFQFPMLPFPGCALLTRRERDVLRQITAAASNKEAARNLGISPRTVEIHRGHLMRKLGAKNSIDLFRIVMSKGRGMQFG